MARGTLRDASGRTPGTVRRMVDVPWQVGARSPVEELRI